MFQRSYVGVKRINVSEPWVEGLNMRLAVTLFRLAEHFKSRILITCGGHVADLRSVLSVLALCATMGAALELEVNGEDEQSAAAAVEKAFQAEPASEEG